MGNVYVEKEILEDTCKEIEKKSDEIKQCYDSLRGTYSQIGQDRWEDDFRKGFEEKFNQVIKVLSNFKDNADIQTKNLKSMITVIEEYENIKMSK